MGATIAERPRALPAESSRERARACLVSCAERRSARTRPGEHAIVDVRARGEAEADAARAAVAALQRMIKPLMLGFSIVFFVVILAFIAAAELR